ncbi:MAG: PIN domain-containing protein [Desulfobulbaceae bacterium]
MVIKYLLDTNVLSEAVKTSPLPAIMDKLSRHRDEIATAAPVWHELQFGCRRLPPSRKRETIETYLYQVVLPNLPILPYDEQAAAWHAEERARLVGQGKTPAFVDGQIAAIAAVHQLILVTRNITDFSDFSEPSLENWHV